MVLFHRALCVGFLAAILPTVSPAQTPSAATESPSENTLQNWLHSGDARLVAWGAHDALIARDPNLTPDLLSLAGHWQPLSRDTSDPSKPTGLSPEQMDERDAMAAVLDALIQTNAPVPADTLRALAPDFGNDVAVLLSRLPEKESGPLSFDFYRSPAEHSYGLQYVSAALLALHPEPGFAAHLVADITVLARVFVINPGSEPFGWGEAGDCFSSIDPPRNDWPLTGQYALSKESRDGAMLLAPGIDPIYVTREQSTRYLGDGCGTNVYLNPNGRLRLVAEMLSVRPEEIQWKTDLETRIEFQSLEQFDNALLTVVEEQQEKHRTTVVALMAHNLLTPSEAAESLPKLLLRLHDMRGERTTPIPIPSNLPTHVEWSPTPF
jgi:hypothetical protein